MWSLFALLVFAHHGWVAQCDEDSGPSGGNPSLVMAPPITSLPAECYNPSGDSCNWYRNCPEKKYPCEATSNPYAIKYAETFCKLYDKRYSSFSSDGQKWIDGVRKCLQVTLVPLLRPSTKPTCQEIRKKAFASHSPCYLNPGKDVPSVCDLGCFQYFKIFWTIKGSFTALDTAWESIKGMWNIGRKCGVATQIGKCFKRVVMGRAIKVTKLKIKKLEDRNRRSYDPLLEVDAHTRFVDGIGSAIAKALNWNSDAIDWVSFPDSEIRSDDPNDFSIIIALADKKALHTAATTSVNFSHIIQEFASAVAEAKLPLEVHGAKVHVKSLASCFDNSCDTTETLAVSDI